MKTKQIQIRTGVDAVDRLSSAKCAALVAALVNQKRVVAVFRAYARWRRRVARTEHPDGRNDQARRWYPSASENIDGFTDHVRSPSQAWPFSYMLAARTLAHCEALDHADFEDLTLLRQAKMLREIDGSVTDADATRLGGRVWDALVKRTQPLVTTTAVPVATAANDDTPVAAGANA